MAQKVISVNINTWVDEKKNPQAYEEIELQLVNKYLSEGYIVKDKFATVPSCQNTHNINITFVLYNNL